MSSSTVLPTGNPFSTTDSVVTYVKNIWPIYRLSLNTTFKAEDSRLGYKTQFFSKSLSLPSFANHSVIIDRVRVIVDTSGIHNITSAQSFLKNGVRTLIGPGYYSTTALSTITGCTISSDGLNSYQAVTTTPLDLTNSKDLQNILGFSTIVVPTGTTSPNKIKQTNDFDNLFISCDLISLSSTIGQTYLIDVPITSIGPIITNISQDCKIPVLKQVTNSITYTLFKKTGEPFILNAEVQIFIDINVYRNF